MNCLTCNNIFTPKSKVQKYCSLQCKNKNTNKKHQCYEAQQKRGIANKLKLILSKGGQCSNCGYKKNLAGLCFHHIDESTKSFQIDTRKCSNTKYEVLEEEAKKCILLCHNCHMEEHYPQLEGLL